MHLTPQVLPDYLLERGVIDRSERAGGLRVVEMPRRHLNFVVSRDDGSGVFVKQAWRWDATTVDCIRREASCCRRAENDDALAALRGLAPRLLDYDPERHALTLELLPEAETLRDFHWRTGEFPARLGREAGRASGRIHSTVRAREDGGLGPDFPGERRDFLSFLCRMLPDAPAPGPASADGGAGGSAADGVLAWIRRDRELVRALHDLDHDWRSESLLHGDLRIDNCLLTPAGAERRLRLVDWELADLGDPGWDAGSYAGSYLATWVFSMPGAAAPGAAAPGDELAARAGFPLDRIRPLLHAFFSAYAESRGMTKTQRRSFRRRAVRFAGSCLLQTAFEVALANHRLDLRGMTLLRLGRNLLLRTDEAVRDLLAFPQP